MTVTREQALDDFVRLFARARAERDSLPVIEAARAAFVPGGPSVEEIAQLIQSQRDRARDRMTAISAA